MTIQPGPEVIKFISCSTHEILNAHKYKKYQEIHLFLGSDKPRFVVALLFYVHGKQLRSCRDGQLT